MLLGTRIATKKLIFNITQPDLCVQTHSTICPITETNKQEGQIAWAKQKHCPLFLKCSCFNIFHLFGIWPQQPGRTRSSPCLCCSHIRWSLSARGAGFSFAQVSSHSDLLLSVVELSHNFARQHLHSSGCKGRRKSGGSSEAVPADPESSGLFISVLFPPQVTSAGCLCNKQLPQAFPEPNKRQILSRELDGTVGLNSYNNSYVKLSFKISITLHAN